MNDRTHEQKKGVSAETHEGANGEILAILELLPNCDQAAISRSALLIQEFLIIQSLPKSERQIFKSVRGRKQYKATALRQLVAEKKVKRSGSGKKASPYLYSVRAVVGDGGGSIPPAEPDQQQDRQNPGSRESIEDSRTSAKGHQLP